MITVEKLNQLQHLKTFIEHGKRRLEDLRESIDVKSPVITDMPKKPGASDRLGDTVPKIVDEEALLKESLAEYSNLFNELVVWIYSVEDVKVKQIMILKFIEGKSWDQVADSMDKGNGVMTADSVRMAVNNYLKREDGRAS